MKNLFGQELEIVENVGSTDNIKEAASLCVHCQHFYTEYEDDSGFSKPYAVPYCVATTDEGNNLWDDCCLDDWPIEECSCFEEGREE